MLYDELTPRQFQIVILATCGMDARQIGAKLNIKVDVVRRHFSNIYMRLGMQEDQATLCSRVKLVTRFAREYLV